MRNWLKVFDVDGTLTDSLRTHALFCNDMNDQDGLSLSLPEVDDVEGWRERANAPMSNFFESCGFKDEHIYNITKRALSNPSMIMYIFIHSYKDLKDFKLLFEDHQNVFFIFKEDVNIDLNEFTSLLFGG